MSSSADRASGGLPGEEVALFTLLCLVVGLMLPGLGLAVGLLLAATLMRGNAPVPRWLPVAVGVTILAVQLVGYVGLATEDPSLNEAASTYHLGEPSRK